MAERTLRETYAAFLERIRKCKRIEYNSRKYWVYEKPDGELKYFLGKSGGVRLGRTVSDSTSVPGPVLTKWRILLEQLEKKHGRDS